MNHQLKNILIPVFNEDESFADLEKLVHIASIFKTNIHLLYIDINHKRDPLQKARFLFSHKRIKDTAVRMELQLSLLKKLHPSLSFQPDLINAKYCNEIKQYCSMHNIDLILFGHHMNIFIRKGKERKNIYGLFEKMNCTVLSIHFYTSLKGVKNIVIPIGSFLPIPGIILASYIARQFNSKIHLIALNRKFLYHGHEEAVCLYKAYHLLHDNTNLQIECSTLTGTDIRNASFQYAEEINAEVVLLNSNKKYSYEAMQN